MPAKLRVAPFEDLNETRPIVGERIKLKGVRCGIPRCGEVLGDLVNKKGDWYVRLLEGFRREKHGYYALHRHARIRYKRGVAPRDARGRWIEALPIGRTPKNSRS